jgi:hypothetical protein
MPIRKQVYRKRQVVKDGGCECKDCVLATRAAQYAVGHYKVAAYAHSIIDTSSAGDIDRMEEYRLETQEARRQEGLAARFFGVCPNRSEEIRDGVSQL